MINRLRAILPSGLGGLTGLACVLCCAIPLLLAAGIVGGAGWAALGQVMPGIAVALAALTALAWWRSSRRRSAHAGACPGGACSCPRP
ncbi:hypothetical protein AB0B66_09830 [Catellatospora sp. NPDC049111]|uniref:hypothetical protein n=1 Tax=Catellatospora sp. NPDC049111 TaxID=3155271 RepID=UPI0033ED690B